MLCNMLARISGSIGAAQQVCRSTLLCHSPHCEQVTALAFPNGRPTGTPDPKADPVTVTNSLNKKLEVIYDWGEQSVGQSFLGDSSLRTVRCVSAASQPQSEALA